ncbi:uncharacterized protein LOC112493854 [Cephus cinctus]|uniref:Uncharacterized protein LOC112493854 n=1 Tax=Cephus cinctus TaxID=211228 RepID=A0AAJ7RBC9_CEPCN|nr:uncharacterized protein LOC112493854 [Cephus cinctus]
MRDAGRNIGLWTGKTGRTFPSSDTTATILSCLHYNTPFGWLIRDPFLILVPPREAQVIHKDVILFGELTDWFYIRDIWIYRKINAGSLVTYRCQVSLMADLVLAESYSDLT